MGFSTTNQQLLGTPIYGNLHLEEGCVLPGMLELLLSTWNDAPLRLIPGSLKSNFKWCRASAKHLCQKSSNEKSEVLQGGCAIMGTSPCSDCIVPIKMSASMAVTGPWKADSKELALQHECAHCWSAAGESHAMARCYQKTDEKTMLAGGFNFQLTCF